MFEKSKCLNTPARVSQLLLTARGGRFGRRTACPPLASTADRRYPRRYAEEVLRRCRLADPRGRRLEPPPGLAAAQRAAFIATVKSVKPNHFAAEDMPIACRRRAAQAEERDIVRDLEAAKAADDSAAKAVLRTAQGRNASSLTRLARALRLGALARDPSRNTRRPGTVEPAGPLPWEFEPGDDDAA